MTNSAAIDSVGNVQLDGNPWQQAEQACFQSSSSPAAIETAVNKQRANQRFASRQQGRTYGPCRHAFGSGGLSRQYLWLVSAFHLDQTPQLLTNRWDGLPLSFANLHLQLAKSPAVSAIALLPAPSPAIIIITCGGANDITHAPDEKDVPLTPSSKRRSLKVPDLSKCQR